MNPRNPNWKSPTPLLQIEAEEADMATEQGVVTRIESGTTWVKAVRSSACDGCTSKGFCHVSGDGNETEVAVINEAGAGVGDRIVLSFQTASLLKASFLLYLFPILVLICGAALGQAVAPRWGLDPSMLSAVAGVSFFVAGMLLIHPVARAMARKEEYRPRIIKIVR